MKNEVNLTIINRSAANSAPADIPEELRQILVNEAKASIQELEAVAPPTNTSVRRGSFSIHLPLTIEQMMVQVGGKMRPYIRPDRNPSPMEGDVFFRVLVQRYLAETIADRLKGGGTPVVEILSNFVPLISRGVEADLFWVHLSDLSDRTDRAETVLEDIGGEANLIAVIWEPAYSAATDRTPRMAWCAAYHAQSFCIFPEGYKISAFPNNQTKSVRNQL